MKLVRADGYPQQQWALSNVHVQKIARILSEHFDDNPTLIKAIAPILQKFTGEMHGGLEERLDYTRSLYEQDYVAELLQAIHDLYYQQRDRLYQRLEYQINSLRGAVVERLGLELVKSRYYQDDECANSRRFIDQHNRKITLQEVDIAAISHTRWQLEGYECKATANSFEDHDRIDLEYLHRAAQKEDYLVHVGVISFDPNRKIIMRLRYLNADPCIHAYGFDTLGELRYSPFDE